MEEYRFELLNEENITDLLELFKNAFNEDRSIEYLRGKYNTTKTGGANFSFIAYDQNNSAAGLYAIFPVWVTLNNVKILSGQVGDIMIHNFHRKKSNLFHQLATHTHEYAQKNGIKFLFSFLYGTEGSYPALVRYMDFIDDEKLNGYNLKINTLPLSKLAQTNSFFNFFYKPYFHLIKLLFLKEKVDFIHYKKEIGYGEIVKDPDFLNYKLACSNCEILEINNVRFLVKINKDGSLGVGDVDKCSLKSIEVAIEKWKKVAFFSGIRILQFEISSGHILDQVLSKKYEAIYNRRLIYLNLDEKFEGHCVKFTFSEIDTF